MNHVTSDRPSSPIELRHASTDQPLIVVVPERRLLAIEGIGHAGAAGFRLATEALRAAHGRVRASLRQDRFAEGPKAVLEIVWATEPDWSADAVVRALASPAGLGWRQMLELPPLTRPEVVAAAIDAVRREHGRDVPLLRAVPVTEGRVAQLLHIGPTLDLEPTIRTLLDFVAASGHRARGGLHQLILADSEAVSPGRARSILRVPIVDA